MARCASGTTTFATAWTNRKQRLAQQRAKSPLYWYRRKYNLPPHLPLPVSIYEIELEMLADQEARLRESEAAQQAEDEAENAIAARGGHKVAPGVYESRWSSGQTREELMDELDRLTGTTDAAPSAAPDLEDVSVSEAMRALRGRA